MGLDEGSGDGHCPDGQVAGVMERNQPVSSWRVDSPGTKGPAGAKVWRQEKTRNVGDSSGDLNLGVVRKACETGK